MTRIKYLPGNGQEYFIDVNYISYDFARDVDSKCAFCHGDPCPVMLSPALTMIAKYYFDCAAWGLVKPSTCPMCKGASS